MKKNEMNVTENGNAEVVLENTDLLEDLFACEVIDTAYTCHENRSGGRHKLFNA